MALATNERSASTSTTATTLDAPVDRTRFDVTGGAGLAGPTPSTVSPFFALDLGLSPRRPWRFGLTLAFSLGGSVSVVDDAGRARGTLSAQTLYALPSVMLCTEARFQLCGGVTSGLRAAIGNAFGPYVFQTRPGVFPTVGLGPAGRLTVSVGPFLASLDVTLLVNLATPRIQVVGLDSVIDTPRVELLGRLSVGAATAR